LDSGHLHDGEFDTGFPGVCQGLLQNFNRHFLATTAGACTSGLLSQLSHGAYAVIHRVADIRIGNCVADTHVHSAFLL
jgi:hypothetical protein